MRTFITTLLFSMALLVSTAKYSDAQGTDGVYWTQGVLVSNGNSRIRRVDLDDTNSTTVHDSSSSDNPRGLAIDWSTGEMYWTTAAGKIRKSDLDGGNQQVLFSSGTAELQGIALDLVNGKMYWGDIANFTISRANLDGSSVEIIRSGAGSPGGIALDVPNGKVYYTNSSVNRMNLDGTSHETIADGTDGISQPYGIALYSGKFYITDANLNEISRADLDGSNFEKIHHKINLCVR